MLLSVTGASGTGKSTALDVLREVDFGSPVLCVEFDSIGVPAGADTVWRHCATERWTRFAVNAQSRGQHVLLFGQVPPGELLAVPSAEQLDGIAICALTASRRVQEQRLIGRGEPADSLGNHLRFGQWFRRHSEDPQYSPEVIRVDSPVAMEWSRWETLSGDDPRWPVTVLDTDALSAGEVVERIEAWARERLADAERAEPRGR